MEKIKKILVVEDDLAMRSIVTKKLKSNDFDVVEAESGTQAIDKCRKETPDLVLLDLMIPEIDGFGVMKAIREDRDAAVAATPIIVLSNLYSNEDIVKAQEWKIQGYFVKAYLTTDDILKEIQEVLAKSPVVTQ